MRDAGLEVIQATQESTKPAVPTVLTRLKGPEEELKRIQRMWRALDARSYSKSLDHLHSGAVNIRPGLSL
jgi:histone deacetylase complex regulatory component SIN3